MTFESDPKAAKRAEDVREGLKAMTVVLRSWVSSLESDVEAIRDHVAEFALNQRLDQLGAVAVVVEGLAERATQLGQTIRFIAREAER